MSECLITKLKSNVNNSSLEKFGECVINFTKASTVKQEIGIAPHNTKDTTITIEGNGAYLSGFNQSGTTFTIYNLNNFTVHSDGNYRLKFTNKYSIKTFTIKGSSIFNVNAFKYMTELTKLKFIENDIVTGNNEMLDKLINLEDIDFASSRYFMCDYYNFLKSLTDNGRSPGKELRMDYLVAENKSQKINGTSVLKSIYSLSAYFTSNGKFYCMGKDTWGPTEATPWSTVYCVGYTDEEIAANWPDLIVVKCD